MCVGSFGGPETLEVAVLNLCAGCGAPLKGMSPRAKYHGAACKKRVQRGTAPVVVPLPERSAEGGLSAAVRAELEDVGRAGSALGVAALALAERIDSGRESGSALAALNRELRSTLAEATRGTARSSVASMRDELAARRRQA